jgi:ABC-type transport system involved in multi-copper enzyme maturation permease subunit
MLATYSLIRRELSAYFLSPIAYVVLAVFLAVTGWLFYLTLLLLTAQGPKGIYYPMQLMLGDARFWLVFLFIPPLLTMRLFAEERSTGTLETLLTAPLRDWQIALSKYVACFAFYVLMWLPTLCYLPVLLDMEWVGPGAGWIVTGIDPWPVVASYLGVALAGAMFLALGLFISSLVRSQMVAALLSLSFSLVFIMAGFWRPDMDTGSPLYQVLFFFTVPLHFERNFSRGLVDTRQLVLYASVTLFCLFLTVRSLESRRWR